MLMESFKERVLREEKILQEKANARDRLKRAGRKIVALGKLGGKALKGGGKVVGRTLRLGKGNKFKKKKKATSISQQKVRGIKSRRVMKRFKNKLHVGRIKNATKNRFVKYQNAIKRKRTTKRLGGAGRVKKSGLKL